KDMNPPLVLCCLLLWSVCILYGEPKWLQSVIHHQVTPAKPNRLSRHKLCFFFFPFCSLTFSFSQTRTQRLSKSLNKFKARVKRRPPPPNCVPLWGSCKTPNRVCCVYCAFCYCCLFKAVCYCRMGYSQC
uniref:Agouti-signaling protein n=1 Tax=Electrophorus electricus TaxID=8005 RepID=A0AAY5EJ58_ELEEL